MSAAFLIAVFLISVVADIYFIKIKKENEEYQKYLKSEGLK